MIKKSNKTGREITILSETASGMCDTTHEMTAVVFKYNDTNEVVFMTPDKFHKEFKEVNEKLFKGRYDILDFLLENVTEKELHENLNEYVKKCYGKEYNYSITWGNYYDRLWADVLIYKTYDDSFYETYSFKDVLNRKYNSFFNKVQLICTREQIKELYTIDNMYKSL